ncbi:MAG: reverse transcriptase family protein [Promethearchaeota archaeon]
MNKKMSDLYIFIALIFMFLFILLCLLAALKFQSYKGNAKGSLRRKRYLKVQDADLEEEIKRIVIESDEKAFKDWFYKNKRRFCSRFSMDPKRLQTTKMKVALKNVVNKYTNQIEHKRVNFLLYNIPFLRRYYFGPVLTKMIYSNNYNKFKFRVKTGESFPEFKTVADLAFFFNTSINVLLGYSYMQDPKNKSYFIKKGNQKRYQEYHSRFYKRKFILKPDGRKRLISMPKYLLKQFQRKILSEILEKAELDECATAFQKGKSILDNAIPHINANTLVKIDLKDFFPSLKFKHVMEVFRGFGYSNPVSAILARLCTDFYNNRIFLPQGAPTSPMIANLYASHLDRRLKALWGKHGFTYTRYADDLCFSSDESNIPVGKLIFATYEIIKDEKLFPNYKKTKVYRKGNRMQVTGLVVNEKPNVNRKWIRELRAQIHHYKYQTQFLSEDEKRQEEARILGKIAFLNMIDPQKSKKYKAIFSNLK